jgi:hypothetical protein
MTSAQQRWADALAEWAIPQEILDRAPESPWGFPPALFGWTQHDPGAADAPSHRRALEVLPRDGKVIDVGVGMGRSSLPLAPRASSITGLDQSESMLRRFAAAAREAGISHRTVLGRWPEVSAEAGVADVVVCHHVFYNVPDLDSFAGALIAAARRRVVVELTALHPQSSLNPLWWHFHGVKRPERPTYLDAVAVLEEIGREVSVECWTRPRGLSTVDRAEAVAFARRRLCLTPDRDPEIDELLTDDQVWRPKDVVTIWWAGDG